MELLNPVVAHYRREHAPNRRYLASEISATYMYNGFKEKFPEMHCSYDHYREILKNMNISFVKLRNEECEICETYNQHIKSNMDHKNQHLYACNICMKWSEYHERFTNSREIYKLHSKNNGDIEHVIVSADLQKVIMLPRMNSFKTAIFTFTRRIIDFHESFVPLGKSKATHVICKTSCSYLA